MFYTVLSVVALTAIHTAGCFDLTYRYMNQNLYVPPTVRVDVYYESLCSDSIKLYIEELAPLMHTLGVYIDLHTYPYGKASTTEVNGSISFTCQHGDKECYGNKLHACAIDELVVVPKFLQYNACLLSKGSHDHAAVECGKLYNVNSNSIKECAKSSRGDQLLKFMGEESSKVSYSYIPHVVINGVPIVPHASLFQAVCKALSSPPQDCNRIYLTPTQSTPQYTLSTAYL